MPMTRADQRRRLKDATVSDMAENYRTDTLRHSADPPLPMLMSGYEFVTPDERRPR